MRFLKIFLILAVVAACQTVSPPPPVVTGRPNDGDRVYYFGQALFKDKVFDGDVVAMGRALAQRYGGLDGRVLVGHHGGQVSNLSDPAAAAALADLARSARDGRDLVVVLLTSHGLPGEIAVRHPGMKHHTSLTASDLRQLLRPLENDRHVVILQACYSGSLIPALQSPNRIILTAARADRTSFGCAPGSNNTWFIRSLVEELQQGGSWQDVYLRTRSRVQGYERRKGIGIHENSQPQASVGGRMQGLWAGAGGPG
ncbi:C13 family peptidase [Gemmobacter denitrificans]|uniref:C13 family peptidase n=1 Tax=Gemmobacter denitrificans TaxID=3123040 RepID=UPI002FFEE60C